MKAATKNSLRQVRHQIGSFVGIIVIVAVAVGFYAVMKTSAVNYRTSVEHYFAANHLPSAILSGTGFTTSDQTRALGVVGVRAAQVRVNLDTRQGSDTLRLQSYDTQNSQINQPHIYEGQAPNGPNECLLLERYARANNVHIGDTVTVATSSFSDSCRVSGLATSPEHVYLAQNATTPIADPATFGILFVDTQFALRNHLPFSELALLFDGTTKDDDALDAVAAAVGESKIIRTVKQADIYSNDAFRSDVGQFELFAYIFPVIFFIISAVVIYVSQRRNVLRDRRQIGILKAMGLSDRQIIGHYSVYALMIALGGIGAGVALAAAIGPWIMQSFNVMLDAPGFVFTGMYKNLLIPSVFSVAICLLATYVAVRQVARIKPAEAMHAESPLSGGDIWLQKTPIWRHLSFNTRYALKAAIRNRGRFWAMVSGMVATIVLLVFSLGFRDSFRAATVTYFEHVTTYDLSIQVKPTPLTQTPSFLRDNITSFEKNWTVPAKVSAGGHTEDLPLYVSEKPFAMHHLTNESGADPTIGDGVVIPRYYADRLHIDKGDEVRVYLPSKLVDGTVKVTDITDQMMNFVAITTFATAQKQLGLAKPVYNTVYATTSGDVNAAVKTIKEQPSVLAVSSLADDRKSIEKFTSLFNTYIVILVFFAIILGIATLYSISSITLIARRYEFILLRVMGYGRGDITKAYTKELLLQAVIAIPIGSVLGYFVAINAATVFATDTMAFRGTVSPVSYLAAFGLLAIVLLVILSVAWRTLGKQRLAEGLKSREE